MKRQTAYVIDNGTQYARNLADLLGGYHATVIDINRLSLNDIPPDALVILTGGHVRYVQWNDRYYKKEITLIKHHPGPIIGICLGAQLIAHVYGVHLHDMGRSRKGLVEITPVVSNPILESVKTFKVYENHHLAMKELVAPLVALATSADGIEIFRHKTRSIFGLQFHPEATTSGDGVRLFNTVVAVSKEQSGL